MTSSSGGSDSPTTTTEWAIHAQNEATRYTGEKRDGPTRHIVAHPSLKAHEHKCGPRHSAAQGRHLGGRTARTHVIKGRLR